MEAQSRFETSFMLGALLGSTPLLADSWKQCELANAAAPGGFGVDRIGDVVYVSFSGVQSVSGCESFAAGLSEVPIVSGNEVFAPVADYRGVPVTVNACFLQLFLAAYHRPDFHDKTMAAISENKVVVFTGHSIGGAIASLAALSLLSGFPSITSTHSLLCVTFGSPLLGNHALSGAVAERGWAHKFCHIVTVHDLVPRLLLAPFPPVQTCVNDLLCFFHSRLQISPFSTKPKTGMPEPEMAGFHEFISTHVAAAAAAAEEDWWTKHHYHPCGSFLFCSTEGIVCIEDATTVLRLFHILMGSPRSSIEDHLAYGDRIARISQHFLQRRRHDLTKVDPSSGAGISLALEALGIKPTPKDSSKAERAAECLTAAAKKGCHPNLSSAGLAVRLAKVTPYRAQIEWYKTFCDNEGKSYYDSFRLRLAPRRDSAVNWARIKLGKFWDRVVHMFQTNQLPCDFTRRAKFVNAAHFYTLTVEPLEIAEYYRTGKRQTHGHYLIGGREKRFEVFDKWWEQQKIARGSTNERQRRTLAGLTQDSCFWARVEEAKEWAENIRKEKDRWMVVELLRKMENFGVYAQKLVERKEVSKDVSAAESSYLTWVRDWEELKGSFPIRSPSQGQQDFTEVIPSTSSR